MSHCELSLHSEKLVVKCSAKNTPEIPLYSYCPIILPAGGAVSIAIIIEESGVCDNTR